MKPTQKIRKPLPTEQELIEWREALRQECVQSWKNRDSASWGAEPEFNASAAQFAKFVAWWRTRHVGLPQSWDILGWLSHVCEDPQKLLREAEAECLKCGIDPRETTLSLSRHYRYLTNGEIEVDEKPTEILLGGDVDFLARWPEIDQWLRKHPVSVWSLRGVICELDGIDASGEPWSIAALNASPKSS
jgi:hypothetical protein